jgi:signal transduction histidine kinase
MQLESSSPLDAGWIQSLLASELELGAVILAEGVVVAANRMAEVLFGSELSGVRVASRLQEPSRAKLEKFLTRPAGASCEIQIERGGRAAVFAHATVLELPRGLRALLVTPDPGAHRRAEMHFALQRDLAELTRELSQRCRELERARARAEALAAIVASTATAESSGEVSRVALDRCLEAMGADDGELFLLGDSGQRLVRAHGHLESGREEREVKLADLPAGRRALETGELQLVQRELVGGAERGALDALDLVATLIVPLRHAERRLGLMALHYRRARRLPSADDLAWAKTMAGHCAGSIARALALEEACAARAHAERAEAEISRIARVQEELIAIVGHDLRNPISSVALSVTALQARGLAPEQRPAVERIGNSARRMASIVQDILDFNRVRRGLGLPVQKVPIDLAEVCRRTLEEFSPRGEARAPSLSVKGTPRAEADPARIAQALANLVQNAIEHGGRGHVDVTIEADDREVAIAVHNEGAAISPEHLPHIFEAFRQGGQASQGVGLGLFIVKEIAAGHGGSVEVTSDPAAGTTFTLRVPKADAIDSDDLGAGPPTIE